MDELTPSVLARLRSLESRPDASPVSDLALDEIRALNARLAARDESERQIAAQEAMRAAHVALAGFCDAWRSALNHSTRSATPHEPRSKQPHAGELASPRGADSTV